MKIETTRSELITALRKMNNDALDSPEDFDPVTGDERCAELQADGLIKYLNND